jgi:hypothetical protein
MKRAEHVARMRDEKCTQILVGKPEGTRPLEDLGVGGGEYTI